MAEKGQEMQKNSTFSLTDKIGQKMAFLAIF